MQSGLEQENEHLRQLVASLGGEVGNMAIEHNSLKIKYNKLQRDFEEAQRQLLTRVPQEKEGE